MTGALLSLFIGPPKDKADDQPVFTGFLSAPGRKAVCGGTTAQIAARVSGTVLSVPLNDGANERQADRIAGMPMIGDSIGVPPVGAIPGIDLVTEGIVTLNRAISLLSVKNSGNRRVARDRAGDGGSLLAAELEKSEEVHLWVGRGFDKRMDPILHERGLLGKREAVERLSAILREKKKRVSINWV